jgi:hypothetical protein
LYNAIRRKLVIHATPQFALLFPSEQADIVNAVSEFAVPYLQRIAELESELARVREYKQTAETNWHRAAQREAKWYKECEAAKAENKALRDAISMLIKSLDNASVTSDGFARFNECVDELRKLLVGAK